VTEQVEELQHLLQRARAEAARVIIGQEEALDRALIAIFAHSHALVEGVPGVAKTLLVRTIAQVLGCEFNRIQFTPDLMPADIIGTNVYNLKENDFHLVRGPIFTSFLLADEINRAPAKTQSALLQAMQERRVSIDRETHVLDDNFTVFATQNPIEFEGTYPLPEAQLDRFLLKISMTPPGREDELCLVQRTLSADAPESLLDRGVVQPVLLPGVLSSTRAALNELTVAPEIAAYAVDIVRRTRVHPAALCGAGPRASQALLLSARVHAVLQGRDFVSPDDLKALAHAVLAHRILLRPEFEIEGMSVDELINQILAEVSVPR